MRTPITPRPRRAALVLLAGALLATGATACEPVEPTAFTVVTTAAGADADPGDGLCATAEGACSLQAAVEEANALDTPTDITVPAGTAPEVALEVTGAVTLIGAEGPLLHDVSWSVAEGAQLAITDAIVGPVTTQGTFLARRVGLGDAGAGPFGAGDVLVEVGPTGSALVTNALVLSQGAAPFARNEGVLSVHGATVVPMTGTGPASITTALGGQTRLSATAFLTAVDAVDACAGVVPVSYGYNLAPDTTCGLAMEGDRQDFVETSWGPDSGDARLDAIPVGTLHCGGGWDDDTSGPGARPTDGDGSGSAACDIGAQELQPPAG